MAPEATVDYEVVDKDVKLFFMDVVHFISSRVTASAS